MNNHIGATARVLFEKLSFDINDLGADKGMNRLFKYKANMKMWQSLVFIAFLSLLTIIYQLIMQNAFDFSVYLSYLVSPLIIIFNFLPVFLIMTFTYFLTNRIWVGYIAVNIPLTIALIINHYKIIFRAEPFKPSDITLFSEALNITQNYKFDFNFSMFSLVIITILISVILIKTVVCVKSKVMSRVIGMVLTVSLATTSYAFIYTDKKLYTNVFMLGQKYNETDVVSHKGLIYSFLVNLTQAGYQTPEGYSDQKAKEILKKYDTLKNDEIKIPNVIAVMSEAFFDPQQAQNLEFYPGMNPLNNFNDIKKESSYGNLSVPGFAGSTASTEYEFLSGSNISLISKAMPNVYNECINSDIYCLPRVFSELGFYNVAIHPGHEWFYNRKSVYDRMGFDDFLTIDDFPEDVKKINYYTADSETADFIIKNYDQHLRDFPDKGYFNFTITIQNHGPYMDYETENPKRYVRPDNISDQLYNTINNYMDGLADADLLLGRIRDYIDTIDTPTVLVFFGDHLPYFDADFKGYEFLGYDVFSDSFEAMNNRYRTPYLIYSNQPANELIESNGGEIKKGNNADISSNFLAAELFEYMNVDVSPFFNFLKSFKEEISVIKPNHYMINGKYTNEISAKLEQKLDEYKYLQFYNTKRYKKTK